MSIRARRILRRFGWTYVAYHGLITILFVMFGTPELGPASSLFLVLGYPALMPVYVISGHPYHISDPVLGPDPDRGHECR
ncbi:MAG: hypothetical protein ACREQV_22220, partial [Candidatus Binatia bacterium]